jgi:site-specific recombinase XerD
LEPADPNEKPVYTQLRKGRWYWEPPLRLRRANGLVVKPLGADQVTAWAYARKLNKELAGLDPDAPQPGTVAWVFQQFFASDRFAGLAKSTQGDYRWLAKRLGAVPVANQTFGRIQARAVRARHADGIYGIIKTESGHATAHYACRFARRVWKWAGRREHVDRNEANPWSGMELASLPERDQSWTVDQVRAIKAKAHEMERPSIALAVSIAYWLGHRQGDVLTLTWTALGAGERRTRKTGAKAVFVTSAYPELAAELLAEKARQDTSNTASTHAVVCEMTKQPWQADTFRHEFRRIATAAGIPTSLQFRDLRATAATELSNAGADVIDMSTHTTHQTVQMARRYARRTPEQFKRAAGKRLAARNKTEPNDGTDDGKTEPKAVTC